MQDNSMQDNEAGQHRAQAVAANNSVWELLDGRDFTVDDADDLLERAYASAYHWRRAVDSTPVNRMRASWLISRCHATLGHGELALHHADRVAHFLSESGSDAADFDHAYAFEARARALACLGQLDEAALLRERASAVPVADAQDREVFEGDLAAEPWFGLDKT